MKNIYVLPTDKSSRVSIKEDVLVLHRQQYRLGTQNIYITSNEGVKDGDKLLILRDGLLWGKKGEVCTFIKRQPSNYGFDKAVVLGSSGHTHTAECDIEYAIDRGDVSKICLTTDTDLIEEGIQSIPNEFLEWFLENPSCEHVELKQEKLHPDEVMDDSYPKDFLDYQIVFPNGESLIDAANEYARYDNTKSYDFSSDTLIEAFTEGANWQSQRMYSKEELKNIAIWAFGFYRRNDLTDDELEIEFNRVLNQKLLKK